VHINTECPLDGASGAVTQSYIGLLGDWVFGYTFVIDGCSNVSRNHFMAWPSYK